MKPSTVLRRWQEACAKSKPRLPGKREARRLAKLCGMKSMAEVEVAAILDKLGIKWKYEVDTLTYQHEPQTYTPDFTLEDGTLLEVKGKMTQEVRKKLTSIKRCNEDERIGLIFQRPENKLSSRKNATRYNQWATKAQYPNSGISEEDITKLLKEMGYEKI